MTGRGSNRLNYWALTGWIERSRTFVTGATIQRFTVKLQTTYIGGDNENWTPNLLLAKQMLYQLRYIPICVILFRWMVERHPYNQCRNKTTRGGRGWIRTAVAEATDLQSAPVDRLGTLPFKHLFILYFNEKIMVSAERFELSTSRLSVVCSNQLNYTDIK